jgi:hypothetical protein
MRSCAFRPVRAELFVLYSESRIMVITTPTEMWFKTFQPRHLESSSADRSVPHRSEGQERRPTCTAPAAARTGTIRAELLQQELIQLNGLCDIDLQFGTYYEPIFGILECVFLHDYIVLSFSLYSA